MSAGRRHKPGCHPFAKVGRKVYGICTCATEQDVIEAARARIVAEGCVCDVEIEVTPVGRGWHVQAAHDDWCPRLQVVKAVNN